MTLSSLLLIYLILSWLSSSDCFFRSVSIVRKPASLALSWWYDLEDVVTLQNVEETMPTTAIPYKTLLVQVFPDSGSPSRALYIAV